MLPIPSPSVNLLHENPRSAFNQSTAEFEGESKLWGSV